MVSLLVQKLKTEAWQGCILGGDLQSVGAQRVERPGVVHRALSEHGVVLSLQPVGSPCRF